MTQVLRIPAGVYAELKKVVWPTKKQAVELTVFIILISVIIAGLILTLDTFFLRLREILL